MGLGKSNKEGKRREGQRGGTLTVTEGLLCARNCNSQKLLLRCRVIIPFYG